MHQLHTVEDVASCLDDCAAQGDAKTPRMLASQLSQQAKQVAGAQSRMLLTLAKAARHCAGAIEARLAGEVDRAMVGERMCERALADAQSPGRKNPARANSSKLSRAELESIEDAVMSEYVRMGWPLQRFEGDEREKAFTALQQAATADQAEYAFQKIFDGMEWNLALKSALRPRANPEWAKKLGSGLYKGTRYAGETARDLYVGAREAHAAHGAAPVEGERKNPRHAGPTAVFSRRLPEIGMLAVRPDPDGGYARASIEVTKAFADEWDHDMLNQAHLSRMVEDAVAPFRSRANFYAVALKYRGREFSKLYPRGSGV